MIKFSFLDPAMAIRICEAHWTWKSLIYSLCNPRKRQVSNGHFSTVNGHCRGSETCSRNLFSFFWLLFILWTPVAQTDWNKMLTRNKRHLSKRPSRTIEVTGLDFWDATVRDRLSRTDAVGSFIICYVQSDKSRGVMMMTCGNMIVLLLIRMSMITTDNTWGGYRRPYSYAPTRICWSLPLCRLCIYRLSSSSSSSLCR